MHIIDPHKYSIRKNCINFQYIGPNALIVVSIFIAFDRFLEINFFIFGFLALNRTAFIATEVFSTYKQIQINVLLKTQSFVPIANGRVQLGLKFSS